MKKLLTFILVLAAGAGLVFSQSITMVQPNGGEKLLRGDNYVIQWNASGTTHAFKITLWKDGVLVGKIADKNAGNGLRNRNWTIGQLEDGSWVPMGTDYRIKVKEKTVDVSDVSVGDFEIYDIRLPDDKLKDIMRGLQEIRWWRKGPFPPGPDPCYQCPPEFDMTHFIDRLKNAGLKEQVGVVLYRGKEKVADLGKFGPSARARMARKGLQGNKLRRMIILQKNMVLKGLKMEQSRMLQKGEGFRLVILNNRGEVIAENGIVLKEQKLR